MWWGGEWEVGDGGEADLFSPHIFSSCLVTTSCALRELQANTLLRAQQTEAASGVSRLSSLSPCAT